MGLFSSSSAYRYSRIEKPISAQEIKQLVSRFKIRSLISEEESLVENELIARRRGNGKISLQQVYDLLTKLKNQNKISQVDRDGLLSVFEEHLN